jgi:linearmycin/streptolysin S transport system ATP-binding protein
MIQAKNLQKQYKPPGGVRAVKDVSFEIARGEVFSLLGPNGAGKTTIISMLSGLLAPTSGEVTIDGHSITTDSLRAKRSLGVVPDELALYTMISARENLIFWGRMYGLSGQKLKDRIAVVLEIVGLGDRADGKVETFSGGMKRRLNIAVGLLHEPKILLMDEPTVGIDPQSRRRILDTVKELNRQGTAILYTTHYMEEAEELSHRIGIIDHGELIALGTQMELNRLVGGYASVKIQFVSDKSNGDQAESLARLPGVHRAYGENGHLVLQTENSSSLLSNLAAWANHDGAIIKSLEIQELNLEAVFLLLTGRALRD